MHPSLASLPLDEKGFVLAAMLARIPAAVACARLDGAAAGRCAEALRELELAPRTVRAASMAALIALVQAPVPAGIEKIHPDWLRERFAREVSPVVQAVSGDLPPPVRHVAAAVLEARGAAHVPAPTQDQTGVAALQAIVFAGFIPLAGPGAPAGPVARPLMEMALAALPEAIDRRGAETLGTSLRRAPGPVVARAAAALGQPLAAVVLEAAARTGPPEERELARAVVATPPTGSSAGTVRRIGLNALATALAGEGSAAAIAVAQRLPPPLGRILLEAAQLTGAL